MLQLKEHEYIRPLSMNLPVQQSRDASHRASRVYYYKLETESYAETKRMLLIK